MSVLARIDVVRRQAALAAPARVGGDQRVGHVLVGVAGGAGAQGLRPGGVDVPVHQAVAVEPLLAVLPELVERRLVVGVDGQQHAVGDPFRHGRVDLRARRVRPAHAQEPDGAVAGQQIGLPLRVGGSRIRDVRARRRYAVPGAGDHDGGRGPGGAARAAARARGRASGATAGSGRSARATGCTAAAAGRAAAAARRAAGAGRRRSAPATDGAAGPCAGAGRAARARDAGAAAAGHRAAGVSPGGGSAGARQAAGAAAVTMAGRRARRRGDHRDRHEKRKGAHRRCGGHSHPGPPIIFPLAGLLCPKNARAQRDATYAAVIAPR